MAAGDNDRVCGRSPVGQARRERARCVLDPAVVPVPIPEEDAEAPGRESRRQRQRVVRGGVVPVDPRPVCGRRDEEGGAEGANRSKYARMPQRSVEGRERAHREAADRTVGWVAAHRVAGLDCGHEVLDDVALVRAVVVAVRGGERVHAVAVVDPGGHDDERPDGPGRDHFVRDRIDTDAGSVLPGHPAAFVPAPAVEQEQDGGPVLRIQVRRQEDLGRHVSTERRAGDRDGGGPRVCGDPGDRLRSDDEPAADRDDADREGDDGEARDQPRRAPTPGPAHRLRIPSARGRRSRSARGWTPDHVDV